MDDRLRNSIYKGVRDAVLKGILFNARKIYFLSQRYVPVRTGFLKRSGGIKRIKDGAQIYYKADYAQRVHDGGPAIPFTGVQRVQVQSHIRMTPKGPRIVKEHSYSLVNKRLVGFQPEPGGPTIYRIMREIPAAKSRPFLRRAILEVLPQLPKDIRVAMKGVKFTV